VGIQRIGCRHERGVCAKIGLSEELPCFRWVNTVLGNLKTAITSTFHAIRRPYLPRYLAEFQWRFNTAAASAHGWRQSRPFGAK
jgi:hypothetical protein